MAYKVSVAQLRVDLGQGALGGAAPTELRVLPLGAFEAVDGRPGTNLDKGGTKDGKWHLDAALAAKLIAQLASQKTDLLFDYEHQSLNTVLNGKPAPAAAWCKRLEWRADGLYVTDVTWTAAAKAAIEAGEYRYLSPVFAYDKNGNVVALISIAITNTPALDELDPLTVRAALSRLTLSDETPNDPPNERNGMDKDTQVAAQVAALTHERDAAKTTVAALTTERDALKTQVAALTTERDALAKAQADAAAAAEKTKHTELLQAALTNRHLAPAQEAWAKTQTLAQLTAYLDATKPLLPGGRQADAAATGDGLSAEEVAMCSRMGVTHEAFVAAKTGKPLAK